MEDKTTLGCPHGRDKRKNCLKCLRDDTEKYLTEEYKGSESPL